MVGTSISLPEDIENALVDAIRGTTETKSGFIQKAIIEKLKRRKADKLQEKLLYIIFMMLMGLCFVVILRG